MQRVLQGPAAALAVVVAVLPLLPVRAVVVDLAAELAHILDDHVHAVRVGLAEMSAAGVVGARAAEEDRPVGDVVPALADGLIPVAYADEFARLIPTVSVVRIAGAGHLPMIEREDEFLERVEVFLTG